MWNAFFWGCIAGSAVFIGALFGLFLTIKKKWIAAIMAFGTGVLIGAAAFELLEESIEKGGLLSTSIGFLIGALLFTIVDLVIAKKGGHERKRSGENPQGHSGLAIFFGTLFDAIPESIIIGLSILESHTVSFLLVVAIFISNFPEGLSSSVGLKKDGYSKKKILSLWFIVLILSGISSFAGYTLFQDAAAVIVGGIGAFAAGGVIAMVSSTMLPEAFEEGGPIVGFITALGLLTSLIMSSI
ncbi:ZIP family metal transporter [Bacillus sp. PS06]|uniref:ZIP family metal transporter n=1 Tax=Bacillus sp. PS06 TaxID=2764176 RepID=UPI001785A7AC|nr:ZIP family metal transporter [Bacillus sp. PS06]MBD8069688.1 ZIP family metal transporter [Bacillus sp. PS06]